MAYDSRTDRKQVTFERKAQRAARSRRDNTKRQTTRNAVRQSLRSAY